MFSNFEKDPVGIVLGIIAERKYTMLLAFLSVFVVTLIGVRMMPPIYEAYTKLHINPPSLPRQMYMPALDDVTSRTFIGNQREILRSRAILARVATQLNIGNSPSRKSIFGKAKEFLKKYFAPEKKNIDKTEVAIEFVRQSSAVQFIRGTNIALISAKSPSPEGAAVLANTIAETYMNYANANVSSLANEAYRSIESQVQETQADLDKTENEMNQYREKHNMVLIDGEKEFIVASLTDLESEMQKVDLGLLEINRAIRNVNEKSSNSDFNIANSGLDAAARENIQNLNSKLIDLEARLNSALTTLTEDHPNVKLIRSQIRHTKEEIKKYEYAQHQNADSNANGNNPKDLQIAKLKRAKNELEYKQRILAQQKGQLLQKKKNIVDRMTGYQKLHEQYSSLKAKLNMLIAKFEDTKILLADRYASTVKIIEPAYPPPYPSATKTKILLVLGVFAGAVFSLGVAFIAEYFDDSFKGINDLESSIDLPVLGVLPKFPKRYMAVNSK